MVNVSILRGATVVGASQDSLEMDTTVQVSKNFLLTLIIIADNVSDINECENVTCGENAECLNTEGSYSCGCKSGFIRTGDNCTGTNLLHPLCVQVIVEHALFM